MVGLIYSAEAFFIYCFTLVGITFCLTSLFRAIGAGFPNFDAATKLSGSPGYESALSQACTGALGASLGSSAVIVVQYSDSLRYSYDDLWRSVGIVWVWWLFYSALTIFFTSRWSETSAQNGMLLVPRELIKKAHQQSNDEEQLPSEKTLPVSSGTSDNNSLQRVETQLNRNKSAFTWQNLTYTVQTPSGPPVLLNDVHGWVKPGELGALMGASGAGKTTLLDMLAQRKTDGTIKGSILVDGKPLSVRGHVHEFYERNSKGAQLAVEASIDTIRRLVDEGKLSIFAVPPRETVDLESPDPSGHDRQSFQKIFHASVRNEEIRAFVNKARSWTPCIDRRFVS
ncbi:CDR ABC transporter-domain-containing protein [Elsinoe ampelina]|uniref:CDR ABC transporter-domain-containing protein n=1 Tax=Elsinoe ampelina TaxID=302913 RepID=A0A6A6G608_9PEZI|nr:CDR ABC transporter-domain-containing protein [Elsinoe ampelina]